MKWLGRWTNSARKLERRWRAAGVFSDGAAARDLQEHLFFVSPSGDVLQRAMLEGADDPEMRCWVGRAEAVSVRDDSSVDRDCERRASSDCAVRRV